MNAYIIYSSEDGIPANHIYKDLSSLGITVLGVEEDSYDECYNMIEANFCKINLLINEIYHK